MGVGLDRLWQCQIGLLEKAKAMFVTFSYNEYGQAQEDDLYHDLTLTPITFLKLLPGYQP